MTKVEKLERAGWVAISDSENTITLQRDGVYVLFDWLEQEVLLVYGNVDKRYIPNEYEFEILCEK